MNEMSKTFAFVAAAAVSLIAGFATGPRSVELDTTELIGKPLSKAFDPDEAKSLRVAKFDEETATLSEFEVAEDDGLWTIPSKNGYPADAERQMAEAATSVMDREILQVVSENAADHEEYGVIDPLSPKLEAGQSGVGVRVVVSDINDSALVDLIVGNEVKDAENQRYVRQAKRDAVYVTEIDPNALSTDFADWIESDLLNVSSFDIKSVQINDYSAELILRGFEASIDWQRRGKYALTYNDTDSKWEVDEFLRFDREVGEQGEYVPAPLEQNEELNADALSDLKAALDDLAIVDVEKKPNGLSANLKAGEDFMKEQEAVGSLLQRGFTLVPLQQGELEILSSEGEVICTMKDGVEYVLRFGNVKLRGSDQADDNGDAAGDDGDGGDDVNRYLFAMARFNEAAIDKPELAELPSLPAGADSPSQDAASEEEEEEEEESVAAEDAATDGESAEEADAGSAESTPATDESADTDATEKMEDSADEDSVDEEPASDATEDASAGQATSSDDTEDEVARIAAEREQIEAENQRKLDEYTSKIEEGKKRVEELNIRFGDWFYVIEDDVFKEIRLTRDQLVKKKDAESSDGEGADPAVGVPGSPIQSLPNLDLGIAMDSTPTDLKLIDPTTLQISWSDGEIFTYPVSALRDGCPCATCREKRDAPPPPPTQLNVLSPAEAQPLRIVGMKPVGNYAYSIEFSDGHDTGIFTLERLRDLGEASEER